MHPTLIIINGLPASGKTTLSEKLSLTLGVPCFSKDGFKEVLADSLGFDSHADSQEYGKVSFELLVYVAKQSLIAKQSVMIEGNFRAGDIMQNFLTWVHNQDIQIREVVCYAKSDVLTKRFHERKRHAVHHTKSPQDWDEYFASMKGNEALSELDIERSLAVDTTHPETLAYDSIADFLSEVKNAE